MIEKSLTFFLKKFVRSYSTAYKPVSKQILVSDNEFELSEGPVSIVLATSQIGCQGIWTVSPRLVAQH